VGEQSRRREMGAVERQSPFSYPARTRKKVTPGPWWARGRVSPSRKPVHPSLVTVSCPLCQS
jgi:hypothetical protein